MTVLRILVVLSLLVLAPWLPAVAGHGIEAETPAVPALGEDTMPTATADEDRSAMPSTRPAPTASALLSPAVSALYDGFRPNAAPRWVPLAVSDDQAAMALSTTCAEPDPGTGQASQQQSQLVVYGCPIRVYDRDYGFGSPVLSVDPNDPGRALFVALHGRADPAGSERARNGETHTVFRTEDDGIHWDDGSVSPMFTGPEHMGEESAVVHDGSGRGHFSFLLRSKETSRPDLVALGTVPDNETLPTKMAYPFAETLKPRSGGAMHDLDMVALPAVPYALNNTSEPEPTRVVTTLWRETHDEAHNSTGHRQWIDGAYALWPVSRDTATETVHRYEPHPSPDGDPWTRLALNATVGPCASSAAAVWDGRILVACGAPLADEEQPDDVDEPDGNGTSGGNGTASDNGTATNNTTGPVYADPSGRVPVTVWAIDPLAGEKEEIATIKLIPGRLRLSIAPSGLSAMTSTRLLGPQEPQVDSTFGWYGEHWESPKAIGGRLHSLAGSQQVADAAVTALVASTQQPMAFLVYHQRTANVTDPTADVETTGPGGYAEYTKLVVAVDSCRINSASRIQLGTAVDPVNARHYAETPGMFNDRDDGLFRVITSSGSERMRFAINDYGAAQYGEFIAQSAPTPCPFSIPVPITPVSPIPEPLTQAQGAQHAAGALVALMSAAMVGYLLTAKRRNANTTTHDA